MAVSRLFSYPIGAWGHDNQLGSRPLDTVSHTEDDYGHENLVETLIWKVLNKFKTRIFKNFKKKLDFRILCPQALPY